MKRNQPLFIILTITTFALCFNSCCKTTKCKCYDQWSIRVDDCTPKHYGPYYLGEVKDYLYFKKGSWWVYKNNITNETDSIYTTFCDTTFNEVKGTERKWLSLSYTSIKFIQRSDKYNVTYYYDDQPSYPDVTNFTFWHSLYRLADRPAESDIEVNCFTHPFTKQTSPLFKEFLPSITIQGKTFTDVAVFEGSSDESVILPKVPYNITHGGMARYYWAKNYGLIQIESLIDRYDIQKSFEQKWELIKYNIVQ